MKKVIGVRFTPAGKVYYFDPGELEVQRGDTVVVETARGIELGETMLLREIDEESMSTPLKNVVRVATSEDTQTAENNRRKEKEAFELCQQKILEHKLDMKLVDVEYAFSGNKILFYFTAEGRIDFRELVKDLAQTFRTRIELRQIGVRDEAKMLGGLGPCGMCVCCKQFLGDFQPVSIKMAKEQSLSLSPTKISGLCGRLMCCLKYEQDCYEHMRKIMPHVGREVQTPDGPGQVIENNPITAKTRVRITLPDGTVEVRSYALIGDDGEPLPLERAPKEAESPWEMDMTPREAPRPDAQRRDAQRRPDAPRRAETPRKPDAPGDSAPGEKRSERRRPRRARKRRPSQNGAAPGTAPNAAPHNAPSNAPHNSGRE